MVAGAGGNNIVVGAGGGAISVVVGKVSRHVQAEGLNIWKEGNASWE